ncbi:hypothetical protein FRACYDRAFT_234986 [Fragilariopsis cylindrus CCMP1102]|uniref:Uncharacterized protein n=1 Tax=Fragilariopsis cylindrus CCMP1102 TaxID=635003 RepID=A0A1E7FT60_9STRA|nr:hypothetical protein FRACYDRAFT_234986 [Fragilariopsis cylindrus CCMP1102]|eukprot:OEU21362.1 hypothetical protein FRACYDRAFT_234986 [Fragilariopsis cylindrus CCMP1102]
MPTQMLVYSSIDDGTSSGQSQKRFGKKVKSRLKHFLKRKKRNDDDDGGGHEGPNNEKRKKSTRDKCLNVSATSITVTDEESPLKQQQEHNDDNDDLTDPTFDRYFPDSFLIFNDTEINTKINNINANNKMPTSTSALGGINGGIHWQAFADARETKISKVRNDYITIISPTNLSPTFQNESEKNDNSNTIEKKMDNADIKIEQQQQQHQSASAAYATMAVVAAAMEDNNNNNKKQSTQEPKPLKDNINAAVKFVCFDEDLIHTVDENQSDLYLMLEKMESIMKSMRLAMDIAFTKDKVKSDKNDGGDYTVDENENEENGIPLTIIDKLYRGSRFASSLEETKSKTSNRKHPDDETNGDGDADDLSRLFRSKLGSLGKTMSSMAAETNVSSITKNARGHFCAMLDCADSVGKSAFDNSTDIVSPLDQSWFSYNDNDSDSVSKLTTPHDINLNNSNSLEEMDSDSILEGMNDNSRAMTGKCFDF